MRLFGLPVDILMFGLVFTFMVGLVGCGSSAEPPNTAAPAPDVGARSEAAKEQPMKNGKELLAVGSAAPDFSAADQAGNQVVLSSFKGAKNVVLIFYPGDDTPGCTKQLCAVRDDYSQFTEAEVAVLGVNPQDSASHQDFIDKFDLPIPLLVDKDKSIISAYGCKGLLYTQRTVYGIDKEGKIVFAQRGMPANAEILAAFN